MTTTIDLFKMTAPVQTQSIRMLNDKSVYDELIAKIIERMESPSDYDNGANIEVKKDGYSVEIEISFSAYYRHDWEAFDFGWHDFGEWHSIELYNIEVLECCKEYKVGGKDAYINLELDTKRIMNHINNITF